MKYFPLNEYAWITDCIWLAPLHPCICGNSNRILNIVFNNMSSAHVVCHSFRFISFHFYELITFGNGNNKNQLNCVHCPMAGPMFAKRVRRFFLSFPLFIQKSNEKNASVCWCVFVDIFAPAVYTEILSVARYACPALMCVVNAIIHRINCFKWLNDERWLFGCTAFGDVTAHAKHLAWVGIDCI